MVATLLYVMLMCVWDSLLHAWLPNTNIRMYNAIPYIYASISLCETIADLDLS